MLVLEIGKPESNKDQFGIALWFCTWDRSRQCYSVEIDSLKFCRSYRTYCLDPGLTLLHKWQIGRRANRSPVDAVLYLTILVDQASRKDISSQDYAWMSRGRLTIFTDPAY